jgi:Flp pilus assembly protein TadG
MKTKLLKKGRGASAVEFAIILPLLVLLVFGIIELTFALYDKAMITNASREGARVGIVYRSPAVSDAEITGVVNNYLGTHLISFGSKRPPSSDPVTGATVLVMRTGGSPGGEVKVRVGYTYSFLVLPQFASGLGGGINMAAETVMRME